MTWRACLHIVPVRALRGAALDRAATPDEVHDDDDERDNKKQVNESTGPLHLPTQQPQDQQEKDARIAELERMVGKLTMKVELQKKVLNLGDTRSRSDE